MARALIAAIVCVATFQATAPTYRLKLPPEADSSEFHYDILMVGSFGGYSTSGSHESPPRFLKVRRVGPGDFQIDATNDAGKPASQLKGALFTPTYGFLLFDVPDLTRPESRTAMAPERGRLPVRSVSGRIEWPNNAAPPGGVKVRMSYWPFWLCEYYKLVNCGIFPFTIATTTLRPDGQFEIVVPDLQTDPTLAAFKSKGWFSILLETGRGDYDVSPSRLDTLDVKERVPVFKASKRKFP